MQVGSLGRDMPSIFSGKNGPRILNFDLIFIILYSCLINFKKLFFFLMIDIFIYLKTKIKKVSDDFFYCSLFLFNYFRA